MQITEQSAIAYVANYFATTGWDDKCVIIGAEPSTDCDGAIDVTFTLSNTPSYKNRFTVWIERYPNVAPFIYGEW